MQKSNWSGNQWPSVDFDAGDYEYADFLIVLSQICDEFSLEIPDIVETLDGYIAELEVDGDRVTVLLDNWTFSLATPTPARRDAIFEALQSLMA
jgi:hypothetical protein